MLTLALAAAMLVCLVAPFITYRNIKQFSNTSDRVSHTREVLAESEGMMFDLTEAESAARGYLLTKQDSYRKSFEASLDRLLNRQAQLEKLVADNTNQQRHLSAFEEMSRNKIETLESFFTQTDIIAGERDALKNKLETGTNQMDRIRNLVTEFAKAEGELLNDRSAQRAAQLAVTGTTLALSTLISLVLLPGSYFLLHRYWDLQESAATRLRHHQRERDDLSRYNRRLLESTGEGIYGIDANGRCTFMNRAGALILGGKPEEFLGKDIHQLIHHTKSDGTDFPLHECPIYNCSQMGDGCRVDSEVFWRRDRKAVPVEYSSFPMKNGEIIEGVVVTFSDITARLRDRQDLKNAKDQAETANESKSQFLANMSHELRTPLNAVIMYSELLAEEAEEQNVASFVPDLHKIRTAGKHLLELVNGVLDLSKIEAGKMELFPEEIDVTKLVEEVTAMLEPLLAKNKNSLNTHIADDAREMVGDSTKIRQVLFNLLSNANKFTEAGKIDVCVSLDPDRQTIAFSVIDSGIGISTEQLSRLFQPFMQADASTNRKYGGTGLGLAIIKRFTELMGGKVEVQSVLNEGSTFCVTLPARIVGLSTDNPEPDSTSTDVILSPLQSQTIIKNGSALVLVIDDDPAVRDIFSRVLVSEGLRCITAADGHDGLSKAFAHHPDLIILDVLMPKVDGWSVLSSLKGNPRLASIPVIMQSVKDDRDLGFMLGASEYLVKPVDRKTLLNLLDKYTKSEEATILIIDDDEVTRRMVSRTLKKEGWNLVEAGSGEQGLMEIERKKPTAILLDLMMPGMDGFEFLETLHATPEGRQIPVVVLTSKDLTADDRLRLNGGVERILEKGALNRDRFLDEVRRVVQTLIVQTVET